MSLNWDASNVENWEEMREADESFNSKLEIVIFDTMHVGIPRITKQNAGEFHRRQLMVRAALGNSYAELVDFTEWLPETFIEQLAGLATNASTKTITQFNKVLLGNIESRVYGIRNKGK
jgi:hypothetical protein